MATEFQMPKLGLTMEEGTIIDWLVPHGSEIEQGTPVLVVETDKVSTEVEASGSGIVHIVALAGDTIPCGGRIAWLLAPGESPPDVGSTIDDQPTVDQQPPVAPLAIAPLAIAPLAVTPPIRAHAAVAATGTALPPGAAGRIIASPNARRLADWFHTDLSLVSGSGPNGRIVGDDIAGFRNDQ